jgi:AAA15 family ATPase/GTPase
VFALGFKGRGPMVLSADGLNEVLSSGTLRGLALVQQSMHALRHGGYLLADELENHLNRQLANVVIDLFASASTNPRGATMVFTTHYPQLLDNVHRKDNVYFFARGDSGGMVPVKYSDRIDRIENKKSEVFASNFIKGTAPRYTDVNTLKGVVQRSVAGE